MPVKLVTKTLVDAGPNATTLQLEQLLQTLPDGLKELYERTIERIPGSSRLEVFIVVEIVNQTLELTVLDVVLAANGALGKTFRDCWMPAEKDSRAWAFRGSTKIKEPLQRSH